MSYKNKKSRKGIFNQIKRRIGLVKIALFKKVARKEKKMYLPQTRAVMQWLRERSKLIRTNNSKINIWVDDYLNDSISNGESIDLLTQFCISKDLEQRYREQGNAFLPTKKERLLFTKEIPAIAEKFEQNGIRFSWWITFNRSYLDSGRIDPKIENQYAAMVGVLAKPFTEKGWLTLANWEDDILQRRPQPNQEVIASIGRFVKPEALAIEVKRHSAWAREEAGLTQSDEELKRDVYFQIACEAEEGRLLDADRSIFSELILVPLEVPERYDFFALCAPDFKRRIVPILPPYPWRMKNGE